MSEPHQADYRNVRGLTRGLEVLECLNGVPGGAATAVELAALCGLHRTTVKRLLETLRELGFVSFLPDSHGYRLASRVQHLSAGFRLDAAIADAALPLMRGATERILWPCSLVMREQERLIKRESTHPWSRLSFHCIPTGSTIPLLRTAAGRAYLAFCAPADREHLLATVREGDDEEAAFARDAHHVRRLLRDTEERGFAINEGDWIGEGRYGAIAVPVRARGDIVGSIYTVFSKRALGMDEAVRTLVGELQTTAQAIGNRAAAAA